MRVKGDGIFSINTSATGGFGSAGISLPEAVVEAGGGTFDPNPPISTSLTFYFDPDTEAYSDAGTTLAVDGDNIRQWNDQSGNSINASETTASRQLVYYEGNLNGYNSLYKTGTLQRMQIGTAQYLGTSEDFTLYTVFNRADLNNLAHVSRFYASKVVDGSTSVSYWGRNNVESSVTGLSSSVGSTVIRSYVLDRSIQDFLVYENGSLIGTNTDVSGSSQLWLEYLFNGNSYPESGSAYYGIILFYKGVAHDSTDTATMHDWLNTKYSTY